MPDLKKKFENELQECDWSMLAAHHERRSLFLVDPRVSLIQAAVAIAEDDVEKVKNWQKEKQLREPRTDEVESWAQMPHEKFAKFLIVQPFVLIQKIAN